MKKRVEQWLIFFVAKLLAAPLLRLFRASLKIQICNQRFIKSFQKQNKNYILSLWHENMILPLLVLENSGAVALVSQHFDGEVISRILHTFGMITVRGSSTRGGRAAYKKLIEVVRNRGKNVVFTPDGPTGPRRQTKLGIIKLAAETGIPIFVMGVAASRYRRLGSWDKMLIIFPFSKCVLKYSAPFYVPPTKDLPTLKSYSHKLTQLANQLDLEAESCLSS